MTRSENAMEAIKQSGSLDLGMALCALGAKRGDWAALMPHCDVLQGLPA